VPKKSGLWASGRACEVRRLLSVDIGERLTAELAEVLVYLRERAAALDELPRRAQTRSELLRLAIRRLIEDVYEGRVDL
jgi:hypothetical protein